MEWFIAQAEWTVTQFCLSFTGFMFGLGLLYPILSGASNRSKQFVNKYSAKDIFLTSTIGSILVVVLRLLF